MFNKIKKNSFLLVATFLIFYFFSNFAGGDRGLFSYFKKNITLASLLDKEANLLKEIENFEFKNSLLSDKLDLDFVETLIREKFLFGKESETLYIINNNDS